MSDAAESASLKVQVSSLLREYASLIQQYFVSINNLVDNPNLPKENTPESITERIIQVDAKLQKAVLKTLFPPVDEHQKQHGKIATIQEQIKVQNASLLLVVNRLQETRTLLAETLSGAQEELSLIKKASDANMNFSDILSYASKLSKYTSAPPNFNLTRDTKVDFEKPYPDEERMRRGILYWQHLPPEQQAQATLESSESESSEEEGGHDDAMGKVTAGVDDMQNEAFWELDLNPDLPS
ncbi:hypothetical protein INT43_002828 [Umbelopsis isabellina]|uniref:Mediator of RNA polymerase II transcription subunit 4 n=1 Tax=Mortierella isabellina TaxID=91625 RepID=A0A8H7Q6U5_MORIS|nr:hypothetical protein INT43_002828 [Umbelopsis isabellina]